MYDVTKAAQAAAVLLSQAENHQLGRLRLMKLLYIADRTAFAEYGRTISGDRLVSMKHGPALSRTLNALRAGNEASADLIRWVEPVGQHDHRLAAGADVDRVDLLSDAEVGVLRRAWAKFGAMDKWELRNWTHDAANCPEWKNAGWSSSTISLESLARAVGMSDDESKSVLEQEREHEEIRSVLAAL